MGLRRLRETAALCVVLCAKTEDGGWFDLPGDEREVAFVNIIQLQYVYDQN